MTLFHSKPTHVSSPPGLPGRLFGYEVLQCIGQGAGSSIYSACHPITRQLYALKHVVRNSERDERFIEQLEAEFEVGSKVASPCLRRSIDLKINRTLLRRPIEAALILELFDGISLDVQRPSALGDLLDTFLKVSQGLHALHQGGYIHCDLKPNNILRNPHSAAVKVIDLGQAARNGTLKRRIQGTPDYMAPEQARCLPMTVRTDVFNFGATMYFCLTGQHLPTLFKIRKGENSFLADFKIQSPHDLNALIPEPLSNLVMECVRTNPSKRPAGAAELIHRLEIIQFAHSKSLSAHGCSASAPAADRPFDVKCAVRH